MAAPGQAPFELDLVVISNTSILLLWDNRDDYHWLQIYRNKDGAGYALLDTIYGWKENYTDPNCVAGSTYCYKIRGELIGGGYTDYCTEACEDAFATLAAPTLLVATAYSATEIEIVFKDNSSSEDDFRLERKEDDGYSEIATIPANMNYYRDSGLDNTKTYTYKIRAKEDVVYSSYSNEDSAQPYQVPGAPGGAALSDITDEQMRLSWTAATGTVTGYKVERSVDAGGTWLQIIVVRIGVLSFLDKGLVPSQAYHYRVRAYGPGGNGAYSDIVNDDTLAQYDLTDFEKWLRKPNLKPCILIEMNPKMVVDNFVNTSGNVYEITITERGIKIDEAWEDGTALTEQTSIATVEANAGSFWCDYFNRKLYIHPSGSDNPGLHLIEAGFWLYGTNYQNGEITFNDNNYLNLFKIKSIPDVTQEIKPLFAGSFSIGSGTIKLINPKIDGEHYFDKRYKRYIWRNRKIIILLGDLDESYSNFSTIFTALMNKVVCDDSNFKIFLRDMRKDMNKEFVLNTYEVADFPDLEEDFEGGPIFRLWGQKTKVVPIPIDWTNKKFKFNDGRSNQVAELRVNDTALTEDSDYYVDLQRSIITFDEAYNILEEDIIEIYLWGYEDSAGDLIDDGAEIFIDLMLNHFGLNLSDLDLDSIYETKKLNIDPISLPIAKNTPFENIFRTLECTLTAYLGVDPNNKTCLKSFEEVAPSDSIFIRDHQISKYSEQKDHKSLYKTINVKYNEDLQTQKWDQKSASDSNIERKFGIDNKIDVNTFFKSPAHAQDLAFEILELVNKPDINLTIPGLVYERKPGDMIKVSRDRFFNLAGSSDELSFRLLKIHKQIQKMKTKIKARLHGGFTFVDNFDDLLRHPDWTDEPGNGSITESGGVLTLALADEVHGEFWGDVTEAPVCTVDILDTTKCLEIITKINSFTVNNKIRAGLYITDMVSGNNGLFFARGRNDTTPSNGLGINDMNVGELAYVDEMALPIWLRIRTSGSQGSGSLLYFDYSTDGYTWTTLHVQEDESWSKAGLLVKNWQPDWSAVSAPFEFFKIKEILEKI